MNLKSPAIVGAISSTTVLGLVLWLSLQETTPRSAAVQWQNTWQPLQAFTIPRRALAAVASASHLYVLGGMDRDDVYVKQVEFAPILPNGTLGSWQFTTPLDEGRFYLDAVILEDYLYVIGGANGERGSDNIPRAFVERAEILDNGHLAAWEKQAYLNTPRRGLRAVVTDNTIYAIGGYNGAFLKSTERARIDARGNITAWITEPALASVDRYIHSAAAYEDVIFLLAGHMRDSNNISYGDVESARAQKNGALDAWKIARSSLNTPRFIAAATALHGYLVLAGGHDGARRLNSVEIASIRAHGVLGKWRNATPLNTPRSAAALASHRNRLYMVGGSSAQGALNSVEMTEVSVNGQLGAPIR